MTDELTETPVPAFVWSKTRLLCYFLLLGLTYLVTNVAAVVAVLIYDLLTDPRFVLMAWLERAAINDVLIVTTLIISDVCVLLLMRLLVGLHEVSPWRFLGVRSCSWKSLILGCLAIAACNAVAIVLDVVLERPEDPVWSAIFQNAQNYVWLFIGMVIAAPVAEELVFRGFLLTGLRSNGMSDWLAVILVSVAFALIHFHYDLYDMTTIFVMGIALAIARIRSQSILPCIAMHGRWNLVAFVLSILSIDVPV